MIVEKTLKIVHNIDMKKKYIMSTIVLFIWLSTSFINCPGTPYEVISQGQCGFNLCKNQNTGKYYLIKLHYVKEQLCSTTIIPWGDSYPFYKGNIYADIPGGYEYVSGPDENGYTKYEAAVPEAEWRNILAKVNVYELNRATHKTGVTIVEDW